MRWIIEPIEEFFHRVHDARIRCFVSRKRPDGLLKFLPLHDVETPSHRLGFQKGLTASEYIVLRQKAYEVEAKLTRRRFDAKGNVRHAARDIGGDGGGRE